MSTKKWTGAPRVKFKGRWVRLSTIAAINKLARDGTRLPLRYWVHSRSHYQGLRQMTGEEILEYKARRGGN